MAAVVSVICGTSGSIGLHQVSHTTESAILVECGAIFEKNNNNTNYLLLDTLVCRR